MRKKNVKFLFLKLGAGYTGFLFIIILYINMDYLHTFYLQIFHKKKNP